MVRIIADIHFLDLCKFLLAIDPNIGIYLSVNTYKPQIKCLVINKAFRREGKVVVRIKFQGSCLRGYDLC